jgi:hypothetical protein
MQSRMTLSRRNFNHALAGLGALALPGSVQGAGAAAPDGAGSIMNMASALQASKSLSFRTDSSFGASVAVDKLKTLGARTTVVFQRPDTLFAVFGEGGEEDVQLLLSGGQVTLFRLSLASKAVLKLEPENGSAFSVPGFFIPFLGLLSDDVTKDLFGAVQSVTPIAQGTADQPEATTLVAVMGSNFTGEVWTNVSNGLPARVNGTWFSSKGNTAASAAVSFTDWSSEPPVEGAFAGKGAVDQAKSVDVDALGL